MSDIVKALRHCAFVPDEEGCEGCPYENICSFDQPYKVEVDAANLIEELEAKIDKLDDQIIMMRAQMRGDCGVCKHRAGNRFDANGVEISDKCGECMMHETHPHWEYEGLPE